MTTSSLADTILEITWVDGTGKVHVSKKGDPEFAAFNGGLGVFGIMTELLIQLTPPSNTQLITITKNDTDLMTDINNLLKVTYAGCTCSVQPSSVVLSSILSLEMKTNLVPLYRYPDPISLKSCSSLTTMCVCVGFCCVARSHPTS